MTADLDYSKDSSNTTGATTVSWAGIDWFSGTFNGDGHTISNINYATTTDGFTATLPASVAAAASDLGFFRVLDGATVENLTLQNVHISTATSEVAAGGVAVAAFASTVTGVSLSTPAIASTGGGGNSYVGGLVGIAYANAYADYSAAMTDGNNTTLTNDSVSGGSLSAYNRLGGIAGLTDGPTTISENYVNSAFSNPDHPPSGNVDYGLGGLVGTVNGTYQTSSGTPATGTAISDNSIAGSISFLSTGTRSSGTNNYTSATIGYTTSTGTWTSTNNLVSSGFSFTNATGAGIAGVDGTPVSPQTLATESTYTGTATGVTDPSTSATYSDLGWNFATPDPSVWFWTGSSTSGVPVLAERPNVSLSQSTITGQVNSTESASALASVAGATVTFVNTALTSSDVSWSINGTITWAIPGSYSVQLVASLAGFSASVPLTVIVSQSLVLQNSTYTLEPTTNAPSTATILTALGAALPSGANGTLAVDLTGADAGDAAVNFDQTGSYAVTVYDSDTDDDLTPATATIVVVPVPLVTVSHATIYFNTNTPPTTAEIESASGAALTDGAGNAVTGMIAATVAAGALAGTPGSYTATLTGTDAAGFVSAGTPVTVVVSDATLAVTDTTPVLQATSITPALSKLLTDLGATLSDSISGSASVDLTGAASGDTVVNFAKPGQYTVTVADTDANDAAAPIKATIEIVPVSVLTVPNRTVYFNTAAPPTAASVLSASGAELTDGNGDIVFGPVSASVPEGCGTTVGTCTATVSGTDLYGFAATPVSITVDVSAAAVSVANNTAVFADSGLTPSQAALASALRATVTGASAGASASVNTLGVNWSVPGTYSVTVGDSNPNDAAATVTAAIRIVPAPVVTLPSATIYMPASAADPLTPATLLANAGATLTDGNGNAVSGTLYADTSGVNGSVAGTYSATITAIDAHGLTSAPVMVTVVIYLSAQQAGVVSVTGTAAVGATLTASLTGWAGLAGTTYQWLVNGMPVSGATYSTFLVASDDAGANISVTVTEAPAWYQTASATSSVVTIPGSPDTSTSGSSSTGSTGTSSTGIGTSGTGIGTSGTSSSGNGTSSTGASTTDTGSIQQAKTVFTPAVDALKPGVTSTTLVLRLPGSIKKGTKLVVAETEPGKSKAKSGSAKVTKAGQLKFATGKLPVGTTTIRFYRTIKTKKTVDGKTKLVSTKKLVKSETVKVKAKPKQKHSRALVSQSPTISRSNS